MRMSGPFRKARSRQRGLVETQGSYLQSDLVTHGLLLNIRESDLSNVIFQEIGDCYVNISQADLDAGGILVARCGSATNVDLGFVQQ